MRILVIDDEDIVRRPMCRYLRSRGFEVVEAADGREGFLRAQSNRPDFVITDIVMPDVEGLDLIVALRRRYPELPIIAVSGGAACTDRDVLTVARQVGASAVLPKPFSLPQLLALVDQVNARRGDMDPLTTTDPCSASMPTALSAVEPPPSGEAPPKLGPVTGRTPFCRLGAAD